MQNLASTKVVESDDDGSNIDEDKEMIRPSMDIQVSFNKNKYRIFLINIVDQ